MTLKQIKNIADDCPVPNCVMLRMIDSAPMLRSGLSFNNGTMPKVGRPIPNRRLRRVGNRSLLNANVDERGESLATP